MNFNPIYLLFLIPLAVIGIICSYTDIKYKKIFNKWIALSYIYIFFLYCFLFLFFEDGFYVLNLILNGLIAFSVGYLLWYFKLWSAGDAKLFSVYAFLVPLSFYSKSYLSYFPSFNLLMNLFVPILFIIMASALIALIKLFFKTIKEGKKTKKIGKKEILKFLSNSFQLFLNYVFIIIILQSIIIPLTENFLPGEIFKNPFFVFAILILTVSYFHKKRKNFKKLNIIFYGVILVRIFFVVFWIKDLDILINIIKISFTFMILIGMTKSVLNYYIEQKEIKKVKIKDVKEGMIMAGNSVFFKEKIKNKIKDVDASGLSREQAEIMKDCFKNNENLEIKIYKTIPFAPFLFLSAVISVLTKSSFALLFERIFQYFLG